MLKALSHCAQLKELRIHLRGVHREHFCTSAQRLERVDFFHVMPLLRSLEMGEVGTVDSLAFLS